MKFRSLLIVFIFSCKASLAADDTTLNFSFTKNVPGEKVAIDQFRLHVDCQGSGSVTVLFEAGLGGNSMEWKPVQDVVAEHARACIYDRAGYAWSDPSPYPRDARTLAHEAHILLQQIGVEGPLILVGHSFGGFVVRELALIRRDDMLGMVLVDASHEDQLARLETLGGRSMMPRGTNFYVSPVEVPDSLPKELRRKIQAFGRMRKTYSALHAEMTYFRESASQVSQDREKVDYPLVVLSRGLDLYGNDDLGRRKTQIWDELQADLTAISTRSTLVRAEGSGHHVHTDDPALVASTIKTLIDQAD
ncbi:MAG: alpha/beta fold hydrolase [Granulosicoccus sp.]